jgi:hypothetical protein
MSVKLQPSLRRMAVAQRIATAIFKVGEFENMSVRRIQFKLGGPGLREIDGGGLCLESLINVIERALPNEG